MWNTHRICNGIWTKSGRNIHGKGTERGRKMDGKFAGVGNTSHMQCNMDGIRTECERSIIRNIYGNLTEYLRKADGKCPNTFGHGAHIEYAMEYGWKRGRDMDGTLTEN